jgi:hypothetical protein
MRLVKRLGLWLTGLAAGSQPALTIIVLHSYNQFAVNLLESRPNIQIRVYRPASVP